MTGLAGILERRVSFTIREALLPAAALALTLWMVLVAMQGVLLAIKAFGFPGATDSTLAPEQNFATSSMLWAAGGAYLLCLVATLIARRIAPAWTLPVSCATGVLILIAGAVGTRSVGSLFSPIGLVALAGITGLAALRLLPPIAEGAMVRVPIAIALGLGLFGTLLLLLGALSMINTMTVLGCAVVLAGVLLVVERGRIARAIGQIGAWRLDPPSWFETVVIGLTVGLVAFAALTALVPETLSSASDVTRQHLPVVREIWQTGSAAEFPPMGASSQPMLGHLLYAVAYGLGDSNAVRILQVCVALVTIAGVAAIGWLCGGRIAATVGAAVFATIPLALWVFGHTHADLIATLFAVTATLCVLLWQRDGISGWLVLAGVFAGFGFATKLNVGLIIVALAAGLFLVGRAPGQWRERLLAVVYFGLGIALAIVPWIIRGISTTGTFPGWDKSLALLTRLVPAPEAPAMPIATESAAPAPPLGLGRSPLDILRGPWDLTFDGAPRRYRVVMAGEFGISFLMLLPLALLGPRTRALALLAVTASVSYLGWIFTLQVPRHLLPTSAIAAAIVGLAVSNIMVTPASLPRRALATAAQIGVVAGIVAVPFYFLPNNTTRLPVDLLLGRESASAYIEREVPTLATLTAATELLPADTSVGYVGLWEGPQSYTEARLWPLGSYSDDDRNFLDNQLGTTPETVLASLVQRGLRHFIWDRDTTRPEDFFSVLLSGAFLRDHTRILAGDHSGYLFEVLPGSDKFWGMDAPRNLLRNPDFKKLRRDGSHWITTGKVKQRDGAVALKPESSLAQLVPVSPGTPYLLVAEGRCDRPEDRFDLTIRWLDDKGSTLGAESDRSRLGVEEGAGFAWRIAPEGAVTASVEVAMVGGSTCEFHDIALYDAS